MKKYKKIALISPFVNPFSDYNSRVISIAEVLLKYGLSPEIITANFNHSKKEKYLKSENQSIYLTKLIDVPAYTKNLSIKRIISHIVFGFKVKAYLKHNISDYSAVYCTIPSSFAPFLLSSFCKRKKIKFVLDVIDLWPESFICLLKRFKLLFKVVLFPWSLVSKLAYKNSTLVITESKQYAQYVSQFRNDYVKYYYLGVDIRRQIELIKKSSVKIPEKKENEIWIAYGGSLNNSYDFDIILSSFDSVQKKFFNIKLLFIGGGELEEKINKKISDNGLHAFVTGFIPYPDYLKWLSNCDVAINSFRENSLVAHSYKFNDYIASSCCVLNNLTGETWLVVEEYNIGLNFDYKENTLEKCLVKLLSEPDEIKKHRINSLSLANSSFSKEKIYDSLYKEIFM